MVEDLVSDFGDAFVRFVGSPKVTSTPADPTETTDDTAEPLESHDTETRKLESIETVTVTFVVEVDPDGIPPMADFWAGWL